MSMGSIGNDGVKEMKDVKEVAVKEAGGSFEVVEGCGITDDKLFGDVAPLEGIEGCASACMAEVLNA